MGEPSPAWMQEMFQLAKRQNELKGKSDAASLREIKEIRERMIKLKVQNKT